jgi:hypothetical protein
MFEPQSLGMTRTQDSMAATCVTTRCESLECAPVLSRWNRIGTLPADMEVVTMRALGPILAISMILAMSCTSGANGPQEEAGVGGGPVPSILFLDLGGLNAAVTAAGYPRISEVLFTMGGSGYGGRVNGIRIGGIGAGGATTSRSGERSVRFGVDYYGLLVEKATASGSGLTIVLGTLLGGGSLDLRLIDRFPDTFADAVGAPYVASMTKEFYALQPYIAFEARPLSWMATRFRVGFMWALTERWAFEEVEFSGPPRTLTGLVASLTVQFGGHGEDDMDDEAAPPEESVEGQPLPQSESPEEPPSE